MVCGNPRLSVILTISNYPADGDCFVWSSYSYMEHIVSKWDEMGVLKRVLEKKLIFIETKVNVLSSLGFPWYFFNAGVLCFPSLPIYVAP